MDHHIGDIAVYGDLARQRAGDLIRRYAAVAAADPEELGLLQFR
jgi:hypothetical protein